MARKIMYLRKSRADNASETIQEVLAKHEGILQEYASREYGAPIPSEDIYREVVSGETITDRPMMQRLLQLLETGTVSGVLVVDPQRLTRGDLEDCGRVVNTFRYTRTPVITPMKAYNLEDKYDRKFFEMELMRGNDYLEYTKEILLRGRIASIKKGHYIGNKAPYGYKKIFLDPERHLQPTLEEYPPESAAVKMAFDLYANHGISLGQVCQQLTSLGFKPRVTDVWHSRTLHDMLQNPVYLGKVRWGWRPTTKIMSGGEIVSTRPRMCPSEYLMVNGLHPALVDEETFTRAQERFENNPRVKKRAKVVNPLASILYCECGKAMSYRDYFSKGRAHIRGTRFVCPQQSRCRHRSVQFGDLMPRVINALEESLANYQLELQNDNSGEIQRHKEAVSAIQARLADIEHRDDEQHDLLESGIYTRETFLRRNKKLADERQAAELALSTLLENAPTEQNTLSIVRKLSDALSALEDPTIAPEQQNFLLKQVIRRITYHTAQPPVSPGGHYPPHEFSLDISLKF